MKRVRLKNSAKIKVGYWQYTADLRSDREYVLTDEEVESGSQDGVFHSVRPTGEKPQLYTGQPLDDASMAFFALGGYGDCLMHARVLNSLQSKYPGARIDVATHLDAFLFMQQFSFRGGWLKHPIQACCLDAYDYYLCTEPLHLDPAIHDKDLCQSLADLAKVRPREEDTRLTLDPALARATRLPGRRGPRVAIQVDSGQRMKDYPSDRVVRLAEILSRSSCDVYLIGGWTRLPELEHNQGIHNMTGHTSFIGEAAALLSQMDLVIAPDSVGAHMGGILRLPTLVVLGTSTSHNFDGYASVTVLNSGLTCSPCFSLDTCPQGHDKCAAFSAPVLEPEEVAARALQIIDSDSPGRSRKGKRIRQTKSKQKMQAEVKTNTGPARISACMMVKDEEEMLPGCLETVKAIADEIIIVDTGSKDRTIEIARAYGAKIYHHPWESNFSKHRNQSISYANGDWFLIVDADERLNSDKLDVTRMKKMLSSLPSDVHVLLATVRDYDSEGSIRVVFKSPRLFRNGVGARYEGTIHNQPKVMGDVLPSDLEVSHYGYDLTPEKMETKFVRTGTLLEKRIEDDPEDFDAYFYLSNLYGSRERCLEAAEYGKKCLECLPESHPNKTMYQGAYYSIGACHTELGEYEEAKKWLWEGVRVLGDDVDLYFTLTTACIRSHDFKMLAETSDKYLEASEAFLENPMSTGLRFTHCATDKCKYEVRYRLLCAHLAFGETGSVERIIGEIRPSLSRDVDRIYEVLHNLAVVEADGLLLKHTREFMQAHPEEKRLLEPLSRRFCRLSQNGQSAEDLLKRIDLYDNPACWCVGPPGDADHPSAALEMASFLAETSDSDGCSDALFVRLASAFSSSELTEAADRIYLKGLKRSTASRPFIQNGLYHFHKQQEDAHTDRFLSRILEACSQYDELPERVLLILAHRIMNSNDETHLAEITRVLVRKEGPLRDDPILSREDLESAYVHLAEQYRSSERLSPAQTAYRIAHALSGAPTHLIAEGDMQFETGDYPAALRTYREVLAMNHVDDDLLGKVRNALDRLAQSS